MVHFVVWPWPSCVLLTAVQPRTKPAVQPALFAHIALCRPVAPSVPYTVHTVSNSETRTRYTRRTERYRYSARSIPKLVLRMPLTPFDPMNDGGCDGHGDETMEHGQATAQGPCLQAAAACWTLVRRAGLHGRFGRGGAGPQGVTPTRTLALLKWQFTTIISTTLIEDCGLKAFAFV